jgi:hypothetical protein
MFVLYTLLYNKFLIVFISVSFTFLVTGHVCSRCNRYLMPDNLCSDG